MILYFAPGGGLFIIICFKLVEVTIKKIEMKKIFTLLVIGLGLSSCGNSACDCVEAMEEGQKDPMSLRTNRYDRKYTPEETGQCVRDYYSSGTLGQSSAVKSALKNARKECN